MKKARVKYYANSDIETECIVVENMEDFHEYGKELVLSPISLLGCLESVSEYGPVVINCNGGFCNLKHLRGDNSNFSIYEE